MADLEVWKDYVTVINAARLNAIRDHIMTNEGNISYQQTLINANTTSIYTNTNNIANLSATRLPRDGSLPMTGPLVCNSGVKTNSLTTISGNIIDCQKELQVWLAVAGDGSDMFALYSNFWIDAPYIKLYPFGTSAKGKIMIATPKSDGTVLLRVEIPGGEDVADITLRDAHLKPYDDNSLNLGSSDKRWKTVYALEGNFEMVSAPRTMPFYLENPSPSDKYLLGAGTVSTMYQFNTTLTLTGYKLRVITFASYGHIEVRIDDAKGWVHEMSYNFGSAGGYKADTPISHIINPDNGIQLKISNCSNISSTSIVLEYK